MELSCKEHCPKIQDFDAAKVSLNEQLVDIAQNTRVVEGSAKTNRQTRRMAEKLRKSGAPDTYGMLRSLSDAEFYKSEAESQLAEARRQVTEALDMQDDAIEICLQACSTGKPIEMSDPDDGSQILLCALDIK